MNISSGLLYLAAGACIMLALLNRCLIDMRSSWYKLPLMAVAAMGLVAIPALFGLLHGHTAWSWCPATVLGGVVIGEAHRVALRRRYRGQRPKEHLDRGLVTRPFTTTDLALARFHIHIPQWKGETLRIAHISDLHVNDGLPWSHFTDMWQRIDEAAPDVIFITGDFISRVRDLSLLRKVLAARPRGPRTFAVLGNHDYWSAPDLVADVLRENGIDLVGNRHVRLEDGVIISGCEDPWSHDRWTAPDKLPGDVLLVLSHTPDNIYKLSQAGADMVFSGHYHAGQFRIPRLGSLVIPSAYGRRFDHGHFIVNGTHLFVTAGIGAAEPPLRIFCPPDIFL